MVIQPSQEDRRTKDEKYSIATSWQEWAGSEEWQKPDFRVVGPLSILLVVVLQRIVRTEHLQQVLHL